MDAKLTAAPLRAPAPESYDTQALRQLDAAHYLHPFTDHAALRERGARVGRSVRSSGVVVHRRAVCNRCKV